MPQKFLLFLWLVVATTLKDISPVSSLTLRLYFTSPNEPYKGCGVFFAYFFRGGGVFKNARQPFTISSSDNPPAKLSLKSPSTVNKTTYRFSGILDHVLPAYLPNLFLSGFQFGRVSPYSVVALSLHGIGLAVISCFAATFFFLRAIKVLL